MSVARRAVGVATKATPAGRVAGAAAHAAGAGAGKDPRKTAPGSKAAQQRQAIEDIKARRKPEPEPEPSDEDPKPDKPQAEDQGDEHESSTSGGPSLGNPFGGMKAPATGGGFVLGLMVWAVVRAYIGNDKTGLSGPDGVKALLRAKFLNKTS